MEWIGRIRIGSKNVTYDLTDQFWIWTQEKRIFVRGFVSTSHAHTQVR